MNAFLYRSEFRINKLCDDIVYYSEAINAIIRVTKEQFLADNPGLTEQDFEFYKKWSDSDLEKLYQHDRTEGRRHRPLSEKLAHKEQRLADAQWMNRSDTALDIRGVLTPKQYRRFVLHAHYGLTTSEIADIEGCTQQAISFSIDQIINRLKKYFRGYL